MRDLVFLIVLFLFNACTVLNTGLSDTTYVLQIDNGKISTEEFVYNLQKNNYGESDSIGRKEIDEYLELFVNFKLKVLDAFEHGLDTTKAFKDEFNSYKNQLTDSYLKDDSTIEYLSRQAYDRMKFEVKASHILVRVSNFSNPSDTVRAYDKITDIYNKAMLGEDFSELARKFSEDPSAVSNGGNLGYFSSLQMVYPFENAAYSNPPGEISAPFKTRFGYHILKVEDKRPSEGKIHVAHIMLRIKPNSKKQDSLLIKERIYSLYDSLQSGTSWDKICKRYSEDANSKDNSGLLRPFGSGMVVPSFSDAAFSLKNPGDISEPVQTPYGWHIIKLINKIPLASYEEMESELTNKVKSDSRSELTKTRLIKYLKEENKFSMDESVKQECFQYADSSLLSGKWNFDSLNQFNTSILYTINDSSFRVHDFFDYILESQKVNRIAAPKVYMNEMLDAYIESTLIQYEKDHLGDKYYEYKMLVQEYREGILLFERMDQKVWNKAVEDTIGLENYFATKKENYTWESRADATIFSSEEIKTIDYVKSRLSDSLYLVSFDSLILDYENNYMVVNGEEFKADSLIKTYVSDTSNMFIIHFNQTEDTKSGIINWFNDQLSDPLSLHITNIKSENVKVIIKSPSKKYLQEELNRNSDLNLQIVSGLFEKGDNEIIDMIAWNEGIQELSIEDTEYLVYTYKILDPVSKELNETRGKVISDYQEELEKIWIKELRSKYRVITNNKALNKIYNDFETR